MEKDNKHSHKMIEIMEDLEEQLEEERMLKRQKQIRESAKLAFK